MRLTIDGKSYNVNVKKANGSPLKAEELSKVKYHLENINSNGLDHELTDLEVHGYNERLQKLLEENSKLIAANTSLFSALSDKGFEILDLESKVSSYKRATIASLLVTVALAVITIVASV